MLHRLPAALLAVCLAAPAFAVPDGAADCCCLRAHKQCHCAVCEHAREIESGQGSVRECGQPASATVVPALPVALPVAPAVIVRKPLAPQPSTPPPRLESAPPPDVLTPPPLA